MVICIFTPARPLAGGQQRNETDDDINVYFDNLIITHTGLQACPPIAQRRRIVEHTDYYPYGMVMRKELPSQGQGIYSRYRYGYQGQFAEKDEETGWNHFELRNYGSRIGRWTATDPYRQYYSPYTGMGNNPVSLRDPDGGFTCDTCPKNAKYDIYRASSRDWSYSSLASGDGTFLMLYNVNVNGQLSDHLKAMRNPIAIAVRNATATMAPLAYGVAAAPAFLYFGSAAYLSNVGKNVAFEFGSQMLNNKFNIQNAVESMDLFDVATGTRFSKSAGLALLSGAVDYTPDKGFTVILGHGEYHKGLEKALSDGIIGATIGSQSNYKPLLQESILEIGGGFFQEKIGDGWNR